MSVETTDRDYKAALQAWSEHMESCEVCGSVENDGTLEEALPDLCAEGRPLAEAEIAADAAAVAAMRAKAGSDVRSVPAHELEPEMVTSDGQEILDVEWLEGGHVLYHVFTPSDDEDENEERKAAPEARGAAFGDRVAIIGVGGEDLALAADPISGEEAVHRIREALFMLDNGDPEDRAMLVQRVRAIVELAAPDSIH